MGTLISMQSAQTQADCGGAHDSYISLTILLILHEA